jgi:hypothetical protein
MLEDYQYEVVLSHTGAAILSRIRSTTPVQIAKRYSFFAAAA